MIFQNAKTLLDQKTWKLLLYSKELKGFRTLPLLTGLLDSVSQRGRSPKEDGFSRETLSQKRSSQTWVQICQPPYLIVVQSWASKSLKFSDLQFLPLLQNRGVL